MDLDPESCRFARESLGLERVVHGDIAELDKILGTQFDFVYSRHVIEHLPDPVGALARLVAALRSGGTLVVQCPNGNSLEYLAYPRLGLRQRLGRIRRASGLSKVGVLVVVLTGGMLHGMDPPRHLWAVTPAGMTWWAKRARVDCRIRTYHLGDRTYSPHYVRPAGLVTRMGDLLGQQIFSRIRGGTHLVAFVRKTDALNALA